MLVPVGDDVALADGIQRALASGRQQETAQRIIAAFGAAKATTAYLGVAGLPAFVESQCDLASNRISAVQMA
jgi:hypothetical protein